MAQRTTIFEREKLYKEVWESPVRTVAGRYGISDVALRKICTKLGVPVPPLGYWAKVAAGQQPRVIKLPADHNGDTRYVRSLYEDPDKAERDERVEKLSAEQPAPVVKPPHLKSSLNECHPAVRRTARALKLLKWNGRGLLHSSGEDIFDLSVSTSNKERSLLALDAVLTAILEAGGLLKKGEKPGERMCVVLRQHSFRLQISEASQRTERKLTVEELKQKRQGKLTYIPDRYEYVPTGKLRLNVYGDSSHSPLFTLSDGASQPLEKRLDGVVPALLSKANELSVRAEMQAEWRKRWDERETRRAARRERRETELERLKQVEEWATNWGRAQRLRDFADAWERVDRQTGALTKESEDQLIWIRNAADWLDPLTESRWDAVDSVDDDGDHHDLQEDDHDDDHDHNEHDLHDDHDDDDRQGQK